MKALAVYALSASTRSRSPRGKGTAPKKSKKAKSEFHGRKRHSAVIKHVNKDEVRKRVLDSLEHLGNQRFSKEPGGYNLRGWLKSLRTLLDDFEGKIGASSLTEDFRSQREKIETEFSKPTDTAQIDAEIEEVRKEETDIKAKLKEEGDRIASRLSAIGGEKTGKTYELEEEKAKLRKLEEERRSASFFSKLLGKGGPSTEPAQKKVKDLEDGLRMLEEETLNLQTVRKSIEGVKSSAGGIYEDLWKRLGALETKLSELDVAKEARTQLLHERQEATAALRKIISELKLEDEKEAE